MGSQEFDNTETVDHYISMGLDITNMVLSTAKIKRIY